MQEKSGGRPVVRRKEPHRQVGETRQKKGEKVLTMKEKKKKKWKRPEEAGKKEEEVRVRSG